MSAIAIEFQSPPLAHRIPDICRIAGVGRNTVYEAFAKGELTPVKWGRCTLVMDEELRAFLAKRLEAARAARKAA